MGLIGELLSQTDPGEIMKLIAGYGPVIEALIKFIETQKEEKIRAIAMDSITKGFHNASETGDTTQLEMALRSHCDPTGCHVR